MPDDFKLPPRARHRDMTPLQRQRLINLVMGLILALSCFVAMWPARGAEVRPRPKIEIVPETRPVPKLTGRINDTADLLKAEDRARIEKALEQYERETFHQIAVLTIPTLAAEPIESYSQRVMNAWKLGLKGIDNGILLVVAVKERIVRVEIAPGMEKYISNDDANEVIEEHIIPNFKRGDYVRGIQAGVIELMRLGRRFAVKKEDVERAKAK
jgi:uncharacterized membrane protein YgcG